MVRRLVIVVVLVWVASTLSPSFGDAQDAPPVSADADIIPRPNSGHEPTDNGDRGGTLQLVVLGALVVGVGGAASHLVRQSRRARSAST